ncbi:MAG: carbon-nitrogen hydrolase family protein [Bdellovibrionota bacterium]
MTAAAATDLDVAILQLTSLDDVTVNTDKILDLLGSLGTPAPDLVSLPENALYMRIREGEKIPAIPLDDPNLARLGKWCVTSGSHLHIGSVPLEQNGRLYNASLLIGPDGSVSDVYRKIHLFDVAVTGHKPVRESDVFTHGDSPAIFTIKGWKFGCTICYDLRFAELFTKYAAAHVDVILIPSSFLVPTGKAHWDIMTRARAIESQAYVLAAAQGGVHQGQDGSSRATYGHSMIIDPWGEVVQTLPDDFGDRRVLRATLSRERIDKVRSQIPMRNHRRLT